MPYNNSEASYLTKPGEGLDMVKTEGNLGYEAGMGQRSKAYRMGLALMGAPPRKKDLRLNAIAGIAEGRKLRDKVTALMLKAEANPEDARCYIVFATPDFSAVKEQPLQIANGAHDLKIASSFVDKVPVGFLVFVIDREDEKRPILGHPRYLLIDPRAKALVDQAYKRVISRMETLLER
jgi:hypothetical protein